LQIFFIFNPFLNLNSKFRFSYLSAAKIGENVFIEANCVKAGKSIAFTNACFYRRSDNLILITAKQQLAILSDKTRQEKPKINGIIEEKKKDLKIIWPSLAIDGGGIYLEKMKGIFASMSEKNNFYKNLKNVKFLKIWGLFSLIRIYQESSLINCYLDSFRYYIIFLFSQPCF